MFCKKEKKSTCVNLMHSYVIVLTDSVNEIKKYNMHFSTFLISFFCINLLLDFNFKKIGCGNYTNVVITLIGASSNAISRNLFVYPVRCIVGNVRSLKVDRRFLKKRITFSFLHQLKREYVLFCTLKLRYK